jgi:MFS family permease
MTDGTRTVPDGGRGWYGVLGAFLSHVVGLGSLYSFGVLFPKIVEEFDRGQGATAWTIGVGTAVMLFAARPAGRSVDRFGPRVVVRVGAAVIAAGFLIASVAPSLPIVILAFGALVGPGMAVGFVPGVTVVSQWFDRRRGLALGIAVSGSGVGTFIMAPLVDFLVRTGGWRSAMRWLALIIFGVLMIVSLILVPGPGKQAAPGKLHLRSLFAIGAFRRIYLGHALSGFAFMVPFVYLVPFAVEKGIDTRTAAWLLAIMGISGVAGRVVLGTIGDRYGAVATITATTAGMAVGHLFWTGGSALSWLIVVAVVYGWFAGAYAALVPAVAAQYLGLEDFASVIGGIYGAAGTGMLLAPPLVGWIFDSTDSYTLGILLSLAFLVAATGVFARLWMAVTPRYGRETYISSSANEP